MKGCVVVGGTVLTAILGFFFWPLWLLTLCGVVLLVASARAT